MLPSTSSETMPISPSTPIVDVHGEQAQIIAIDHEGQTGALMRTAQRRVVRVPVDLLSASHDGSYRLAFSLALLSDETSAGSGDLAAGTASDVGADSGSRTVSMARHSLRNLPLKLSVVPFCHGLPGSISAHCIPCSVTHFRSATLTNSGP